MTKLASIRALFITLACIAFYALPTSVPASYAAPSSSSSVPVADLADLKRALDATSVPRTSATQADGTSSTTYYIPTNSGAKVPVTFQSDRGSTKVKGVTPLFTSGKTYSGWSWYGLSTTDQSVILSAGAAGIVGAAACALIPLSTVPCAVLGVFLSVAFGYLLANGICRYGMTLYVWTAKTTHHLNAACQSRPPYGG